MSFEINEPGIYLVLGRNGAGKTTLFRAVSGIIEPFHGSVWIDGASPYSKPAVRKKIAFLSHQDAIPEGYTVNEAMDIFSRIAGADSERREEIAKLVGVEELRDSYVGILSQGQKRKVSVAKSLLADRSIYIMDEPTASLDPKAAANIRSLLLSISRDRIVLYSSHNLYEAHDLSSRVILLDKGELKFFGHIEEAGEGKTTVGIRADGVEQVYPAARKEGPYYILELDSLDMVQEIIDRLGKEGIRIREIREMNNPLEDFFE